MVNTPGFYEELQRKTNLVTNPIKEYLLKTGKKACIQQVGSMFTLFFGAKKVNNFEGTKNLDNETFARFFRYMFAHGVYIPPLHVEAWFVSMTHTDEHLNRTCDLILDFLQTG